MAINELNLFPSPVQLIAPLNVSLQFSCSESLIHSLLRTPNTLKRFYIRSDLGDAVGEYDQCETTLVRLTALFRYSTCLGLHSRCRKATRNMRFPIYEHLLLLNQNLTETVRILRNLRTCPGIPQNWFKYYEAEIEELRAEASGDVLNVMDDFEQQEGVRFGKQRRAFEQALADPDDVYIDVMKREEERRKQGLPPRIGVMSFASPRLNDDVIVW